MFFAAACLVHSVVRPTDVIVFFMLSCVLEQACIGDFLALLYSHKGGWGFHVHASMVCTEAVPDRAWYCANTAHRMAVATVVLMHLQRYGSLCTYIMMTRHTRFPCRGRYLLGGVLGCI